jgi:peroxiredoxin (alkyl hydroperoxide reductase subunit C)
MGGVLLAESFKPGCQRPTATIFVDEEKKNETASVKEEKKNMIKVGALAPDFELPAYHKGEFKTFRLSEFKGKWVLVCFYPGDFTFV